MAWKWPVQKGDRRYFGLNTYIPPFYWNRWYGDARVATSFTDGIKITVGLADSRFFMNFETVGAVVFIGHKAENTDGADAWSLFAFRGDTRTSGSTGKDIPVFIVRCIGGVFTGAGEL